MPDGLTLSADRDDLIRLFVNLLDNAIRFTERGGITLSAGYGPDRRLSVTAADAGIGIPAEHLPHVFDRFYRVDPARSGGGAGLGLAIAREIARLHGGTIRAASAPAAGTRVTVLLL